MALVARFGLRQADIRGSDCTVAEAIGDLVYLAGPPVSGRDQVRRADPSDVAKMPAVGVIVNKLSATSCQVQWMGETTSIFSGLATGKSCFVGPDGRVAALPSRSPAGKFAQIVGVATAPTRFYVRPDGVMAKIFE